MMRNFRRTYRKLRHDIISLLGNGNGSQSRYFICGFVVLGIFTFASLHAVINVLATSHHYSEVGYFDLYGENLTSCWGGSFVGKSSSAWPSTLDFGGAWHYASLKKDSNKENSIRLPSRQVFKVNQSLAGPFPSIQAGQCVEYTDQYSYLRPFQSQKITCFPSFMIVGAMKCGTGELMKWLELHPYLKVIGGPGNKRESHFFTRGLLPEARKNPNKNDILRAYSKHLPTLSAEEANKVYTYEKSPDYMRSATSLSLLQSTLPNLRIIIILRNPVYRALSEFSHHCRHRRYVRLLDRVDIPASGKTPARSYARGSVLRVVDETNHDNVPGSSSIAREPLTANQINNSTYRYPTEKNYHMMDHIVDLRSLPLHSYIRLRQPCSVEDMVAYFQPKEVHRDSIETNRTANSAALLSAPTMVEEISNGFYDEQLEKVFKIFSPSQVLILLQEDMFRNTYRTLRRVESFLGLPCYDYSKVAYSPDPDSPPVRKAKSIHGKAQEYFRGLLNILVGSYSANAGATHEENTIHDLHQAKAGHSSQNHQIETSSGKVHHVKSVLPTSTGEKLFQQTPKSFQAWLITIYSGHNRKLIELFNKVYGWRVTTTSNSKNRTNSSSSNDSGNNKNSIGPSSYGRQPFIDIVEAHWNL